MSLKENRAFKDKLNQELAEVRFSGHGKVLSKTHPKSYRERLSSIWNKELHIPVLPIVLAAGLILTTVSMKSTLFDRDPNLMANREMIEFAGYTYWKDDFERAVKLHENKNQN